MKLKKSATRDTLSFNNAPYKKWWTSQASIKAGEDDEFLDLAYKSGCRHLFIGFESVTQISLDGANKSFNKVERYKEIIRQIVFFYLADLFHLLKPCLTQLLTKSS